MARRSSFERQQIANDTHAFNSRLLDSRLEKMCARFGVDAAVHRNSLAEGRSIIFTLDGVEIYRIRPGEVK